jgi:RimJ/RimL family protein N-acetyltransferase
MKPLSAGPVRLVPHDSTHDEQTVSWLASGELRESFGLSQTPTLASHRAWVANTRDLAFWAILDEQSHHLGDILLHLNTRHRSAYLQIYLGSPAARGRGIGRAAVDAVLGWAFDDARLHRVWLHTLPGNDVAERLYSAAGFTREGVEREALARDDGMLDQYRWSMLSHEWTAR